jgi:hypothetical protein
VRGGSAATRSFIFSIYYWRQEIAVKAMALKVFINRMAYLMEKGFDGWRACTHWGRVARELRRQAQHHYLTLAAERCAKARAIARALGWNMKVDSLNTMMCATIKSKEKKDYMEKRSVPAA